MVIHPCRAARLMLCALVVGYGCARTPSRPKSLPKHPAAVAATLSSQGQATVLEGIDSAWPKRDDPETLTRLIADLETYTAQSESAGPAAAKQLVRLSRSYFLCARAQRAAHDRKGMQQSLARGVLVGERALVALYPAMDDVTAFPDPITAHLHEVEGGGMDALTWYVSNLGAYAASRGMTSLIFYRDQVTAILQRMLTVDPDFLHSTPHRYWAILLARAPSFAGGSLEQARIHFEHAMEASPQYFANACDFAQFYAVPKGDRPLFVRLLEKVLAGNSDALDDAAPEMRLEQARARDLLARVETLF